MWSVANFSTSFLARIFLGVERPENRLLARIWNLDKTKVKDWRYLGNGSVSIFSSVKRYLDKRKVYLPSSLESFLFRVTGAVLTIHGFLASLGFEPLAGKNSNCDNSETIIIMNYISCAFTSNILQKHPGHPTSLILSCGAAPKVSFHDKQNFTKLKVVGDDYLLNWDVGCTLYTSYFIL